MSMLNIKCITSGSKSPSGSSLLYSSWLLPLWHDTKQPEAPVFGKRTHHLRNVSSSPTKIVPFLTVRSDTWHKVRRFMFTFFHKRCIISISCHYDPSHRLLHRINRAITFIHYLTHKPQTLKISLKSFIIFTAAFILFIFIFIIFIFFFIYFCASFWAFTVHIIYLIHHIPISHKMAGSHESNPNIPKASSSKKSKHSEKSGHSGKFGDFGKKK